jgi:hypothetical protein
VKITIVNKHWHKPTKDDCYCGRGSPLGNPYSHMQGTKAEFVVASREEAVEKYLSWFTKARFSDPIVYQALTQMVQHIYDGHDLNLVCYCAPALCHCSHIKKYLEDTIYDIRSCQPG